LASPKTSLKQVFLVEVSYLKLRNSKLSATSSFGKNIDYNISSKIFKTRSKKLETWNSIQVRYLERDTNQQFLESYHNFFLAHQIVVRPMALHKRHIMVLQVEISDLEGLKF
jgi:hypothetical protein